MSYKIEPTICSRDTAQSIPCVDRCQLIILWMSNIKYVRCKLRLHAALDLDLLAGVCPACYGTSVFAGRPRPRSMPLATLTMKKELHGFLLLCMRVVQLL